jgi:hypothetical protein
VTPFRELYFRFMMEGTAEAFVLASAALNQELSQGCSLEKVQKCMDEVREDAELLYVLVTETSLGKVGDA